MCDSDSSDSGSSGSSDYSNSPEPSSYSAPDPTPYSPPSEPAPSRDYSNSPGPSDYNPPSSPFTTNPEHPHENTGDFQSNPDPAYPLEPTEAELFAAELIAGTIGDLMDDETWDEYFERTGRRYRGKRRSGRGRTRRTSVPGKNLAATFREPSKQPAFPARYQTSSPISSDPDTLPDTVAKSNTGRNVTIALSVVAVIAILVSMM